MKKIFISSIVALALVLGSAGSAQAAFTTYLTVGSTGADVVALQTWLISNNFGIPAITSGAAAKGYFGQQTKAAVVQYQASVGLPSTGYVGPLTIAKLNGTAGGIVMTPVTCPIGYICTVAPGTTPANPINTGTTGTITTPGVGGSLAVSLQSTPSNGTSLSKGQEGDIASYKVQAGSSDMALGSIYLDFNNRLWLYADSVTIKDGSTVIAGKSNLNVNDFTELTVGSSYRLNLGVSGYVIPRAGTRYLTVNVHMLPVSDRSSATIGLTQIQTRATDGTGVTDTQTLTSTRTFSYTGSNNGQVVATLASDSPLQKLIQVSQSSQTDNVLLAKYNIKSQNIAGTLRTLTIQVHTSGIGVSTLFGDIKIKVNGRTYSADSYSTATTASSTVVFTNMSEVLTADVYTPIEVLGKINKDTSGTTITGYLASTTLVAGGAAAGTNNPAVEDASYSNLAVNGNIIDSSDLTFSSSSAVLSGLSATVTSQPTNTSGILTSLGYTFKFTMTAGDNTLYISSDPYQLLATSSAATNGFGSVASTTWNTSITADVSSISGDSSSAFIIPAGSSRTFTVSGRGDNTHGSNSSKTVSVTSVKYGTSSSAPTANQINYNLSTLKVTY